jgi:glycosyltransferase involved in cell wall biosynthesis
MKNNTMLFVTGSLSSGGLEKIVANLANFYARKKIKVVIVCLLSDGSDLFQKIDVSIEVRYFCKDKKRKKIKILNTIAWIRYLKKLFKSYSPSIVVAMSLKIASLCSLAKRDKAMRLVMREMSDPKSKARSPLSNRICFLLCKNKVDGVIFQTEWEKSCYPLYLKKKGVVVPNPVSVNGIIRDGTNDSIVTLGRIDNFAKRHDLLIKAFSMICDDYQNIILEFYGEGPDLNKNIDLCKKLGIEKKVIFHKPVLNVLECIRNSKCFVLCSDFEGLSNALIESVLIGIPSISTNWNGVDDIIENNVSGIIIEKNSVDQLSQALRLVLDNDEFAENLSKNGQKLSDKFNPDCVFETYRKMIEGV